MKKHIILSVNDNPDYLFHVPLTCWAWRKFGWEPILFVHGDDSDLKGLSLATAEVPFVKLNVELYNDAVTVTQISRLYGACVADGYIMTGDIDMLPLSDYWQPNMDGLTVYGRDLTDYHYPICYIGAPAPIWKDIMDLVDNDYNTMIEQDLDSMPNAISKDKSKRWVVDQDLITARINESKYTPTHVLRGTDKRTGYPIGRVDRSKWTLDHKTFIDCHMFHGIQRDEDKFRKTLELLHTVWPEEDFKWFVNYYKEFKKLCQK